MSKPPWDKFVRATGKVDEMNQRVRDKVYRLVEDFKHPTKVIIGRHWIEELTGEPSSYWVGDFGLNLAVEIVDGDRLEVV